MTSDEARDLFVDALDGTLSAEQQGAFDAALAADAELREEWASMRTALEGVARLGGGAAKVEETPTPDLLPKVQSALRKRSRGRFYRDRFAEQAGPRSALPLLVAILIALTLAATWVAMQSVIVIEAPPTSADP